MACEALGLALDEAAVENPDYETLMRGQPIRCAPETIAGSEAAIVSGMVFL
jgi:hypothetical protein